MDANCNKCQKEVLHEVSRSVLWPGVCLCCTALEQSEGLFLSCCSLLWHFEFSFKKYFFVHVRMQVGAHATAWTEHYVWAFFVEFCSHRLQLIHEAKPDTGSKPCPLLLSQYLALYFFFSVHYLLSILGGWILKGLRLDCLFQLWQICRGCFQHHHPWSNILLSPLWWATKMESIQKQWLPWGWWKVL